MEFRFFDDATPSQVIDFLRGPRLGIPRTDYPDFDDWLDRAHSHLVAGTKRAIGCVFDGNDAGMVLFQRHRELGTTLELKNLTVRPMVRGRFVGSFLLRQAEFIGRTELKSTLAICDCKAANKSVLAFLTSNGYRQIQMLDLYAKRAGVDVVLVKDLRT